MNTKRAQSRIRSRSETPSTPAVASWRITEELRRTPWTITYQAAAQSDDMVQGGEFAIIRARPGLNEQRHQLALGMLAREATVGQSVDHPHVMPTLAVEYQDGEPLLLQPLRVNQLAIRPRPAVLWTIRQAAEGLAALHTAGWLHGNITPESILVSTDGHTTLIDFGLARWLDSDECDLAESPFAGHLRHSAPEMFDSRGRLTTAADVYSLGVVLFEKLLGKTLLTEYQGEALVAAKRMLARFDIPNNDCSVELNHLLSAMLARDPVRRPTASEVVQSLVASEIEAFSSWAA